jgi:hypothetical protein
MCAAVGSTPRILLGHGFEEDIDFKDRDVMPPGTVLVALTDFGTPAILTEFCNFLEAFADPSKHDWFENPRANKAQLSELLGRSIRIYEPGMKYPKLHASLLNQHFFDVGKLHYGVSGVYEFPIELTPIGSGTEPCEKYYDVINIDSRKIIEKDEDVPRFLTNAYGKSLFPTKDAVKAIFDAKRDTRLSSKHDHEALEKKLIFPVSEIMARFGPGVYFHVLCRSIQQTEISDSFENLIKDISDLIFDLFDTESFINTNGTVRHPRADKYKVYLGGNEKQKWQSHIDNVIRLVEADLAETPLPSWLRDELVSDLEKLKKLARKGRLVRVESQLQQHRGNRAATARRARRAQRRSRKSRRQNKNRLLK